MAQTTGAISARNLHFTLNSQNISGSSNKLDITPTLQAGEFFTFDGNWRGVVGDKFAFSGTFRAMYTEGATEGYEVAYAAFEGGVPVAFTAAPRGNTAGYNEFSGNILITEVPMSFEAGSGNAVMVEFSFEGNGELTKAAIATT